VSPGKRVRAIVGYGLAGSAFHAPLIASTDGMEVAAIITRSQGRQEQAQADYPGAKVFSSLEEVFANHSEYDLLVVATPNDTHLEIGLASIEAGMATVIDKPIAISSLEVQALMAAAAGAEVLLSVFQNRRWDNDFLTVKSLLDSGALGKITRMESRFERYRLEPKPGGWRETTSASAGGGLLFDLGSHLIDQAMVLFGRPERVYAEIMHRRVGVAGDDDTFVALNFSDDVVVHIWVSMLAPAPGPRFRISGIKGAYEKWGLDPQENALKAGDRPSIEHSRTRQLDKHWGRDRREDWGKLSTYVDNQLVEKRLETLSGCYQNFYAAMRDAIRLGSAVPVPASDALACLKVIEAARLSAQNSAVIKLEI